MTAKRRSKRIFSQLAWTLSALLMSVTTASADGATLQLSFGTRDILHNRQVNGTNGKALIRGRYTKSFGKVDLGISLAAEDAAQTFNSDGSYVNLNFGDWVLGAGAVDRHWSYSPHTSLILSANARPMRSAYLKKTTNASTSPLLSWAGPWGGEFFVGQSSGGPGSGDVDFMGARLELEPVTGLKAEFIQTAQFTGGIASLGTALAGNTNEGSGAEINKMAGFGLSYSLNSNRVYLQAIGEDEAGGLPSCWMHLIGLERKMDAGGIPTTLNIEIVDTRIDRTTNGYCGPNTAYNNSTHPYTNEGSVMGASIDSEGKSIQLSVEHSFGVYDFEWGIGQYTVNDNNSPSHRLASRREEGRIYHMGLARQIRSLRLSGTMSHQGLDLDRAGIRSGLAFNITAERRF